jgi:hypothetical protein
MADTVEYYQNLVAENPYDVQNWDGLIFSVKNGPAGDEQTAKLREIYENIVSIFPTAVRGTVIVFKITRSGLI